MQKMRRFKRSSLYVPFVIFFVFSLIYTIFIMNTLNQSSSNDQYKETLNNLKIQIENLESKSKESEKNLKDINIMYEQIKVNKENLLNKLRAPQPVVDIPVDLKLPILTAKKEDNATTTSNDQCIWLDKDPMQCTTQMYDVYNQHGFDDVDGGVWKQGWDINYDTSKWNSNNMLNIVITPHSHNDPGWLMTFEEYFQQKTKHIIDAVINSLSVKPTRKFIWAEISYLSLWWSQASEQLRTNFKHLVSNGQLEIVTGGWVMNDEANTHYFSMIEQMVEGHQWLRTNIDANIDVNNGWSIDPFGYTPTMAYILKKSGFQHMVIQRVHYSIKKYLAKEKKLEFYWKQLWDRDNVTDIFTHVMPFYSYDIPHTCGPDPKICCQFDFKRLDAGMSCPWGRQPELIEQGNVEERAKLLLDQYRKKSELYNQNSLFVQLGDDFRYTSLNEANTQFENYEKLIDYMNSRKDWFVNIQFGTLRDYFKLIDDGIQNNGNKFNTLNGDFFTYADRQDHYWSGYYTSRPLYKRLDRIVEYYLRSAEILFSYLNVFNKNDKFKNDLYKKLLVSRRNLGIFQHHDGITGTAKTAVVNDYGIKLVKSIQNSQYVIQKSIETMIQTNPSEKNDDFLIIDDERLNSESLLIKKVLLFDDTHTERTIYLFNPSEHKRSNEIVSVYINTKSFQIHDESNGVLIKDYQLNLLWTRQQSYTAYVEHSTDTFEVLFHLKTINQFEIRKIKFVFKTEQDEKPSRVKFYLPEKSLHINKIDKIIDYEVLTENSNDMVDVDLFDSNLKAKFSKKTGLLQEITDPNSDKRKFKTQVKFKSYGVTNAREKSGAYLFLPDSAKSTELNYILKWYRIELGELRIRVCSHLLYVVHCVEFFSFDFENDDEKMQPRFGIWNLVDIQLQNNFEFVMNLNSDVENTEREFYTDLNGYQYIKRKTFDKLPVQANVYPMPSAVYIQDQNQRLSVISAQPLGVDCLVKSEIEIFLDRRLNQDDNRGLEQPILDNKLTSSRFFVLFERRSQKQYEKNSIHPSLTVQSKSFHLSNPLLILFLKSTLNSNSNLNLISPEFDLPCDIKLINMRTLHDNSNEEVTNTIGFIFHRLAYDCSFDSDVCKSTNSLRHFSNFFNPSKNFEIKNLTNSHLTMTKDKHVFNDYSFDLMDFIKPNEIESFKLSF